MKNIKYGEVGVYKLNYLWIENDKIKHSFLKSKKKNQS